jgi:hypothetical protein
MTKIQIPPLNEGETYVGAIGDRNGDVYHLILLPGGKDDVSFADALEWAKSIGGDLPNRVESAMLFANARNQFERRAYWTNETFVDRDDPDEDDAKYAWSQHFYYGGQGYDRKRDELRARAVRRLPI